MDYRYPTQPPRRKVSNPFIPHTSKQNPMIPDRYTRGSLAYITGQVIQVKPPGILPIAKSVHVETPPHSRYGFKFDMVQLHGSGGWTFPGHGVKPYPTCGEYAFKGCLDQTAHPGQAFVKRIKHNCGRAGCPVCSPKWLVETTKKIAHRLAEASKLFRKWGWRRHRPIHVTVSLPRSEWDGCLDMDKYGKTRRKAQQIAKKAGFNGGSIIFHPYRERCADCGGTIQFKKRGCIVCRSEDVVWYYSPHFHLFGFGWIVNTKELHASTGWLVKNHGIRSSIDATAYYQLTHCGLHEAKHTVTWFGVMHHSKLKIDPPEDEGGGADNECPICFKRLRFVRYEGSKPPPELEVDEEAIIGATGWHYIMERLR